MGKKIIMFALMMLALFRLSYAQATATIGAVVASPTPYTLGQEVDFPLNVTNFNSIGAISLNIGYDPNVIAFVGISNIMIQVSSLSSGIFNSEVILNWYWTGGSYPTCNGQLCTLRFVYLGGACNLNFDPGCEITTVNGVYPNISFSDLIVSYTGSSISSSPSSGQMRLLAMSNPNVGESVFVNVMMTNLANIGAVSLNINYDNVKLTYAGHQNGILGNNIVVSSDGVQVHANWSAAPPNTQTFTTPEQIAFTLIFVYNGVGNANLSFGSGCEIEASLPNVNPVVLNPYLINGTVIGATDPSNTVTLSPATENKFNGETLTKTVAFSGFGSIVQALTLNLPYDIAKLTYINFVETGITGLVVSANPGTGILHIEYSNNIGVNINPVTIALNFQYNGGGTASVSFGSGSEIIVVPNTPAVVNYGSPATVSQNSSPLHVTIGNVSACYNSEADIPVTFSGNPLFIADAVTLNIGYDASKLTFISAPNIPGLVVGTSSNPQQVNLIWSIGSSINLNGQQLLLKFEYLGGGSTNLTFNPGTIISDNGTNVNATYYNGSVNQSNITGHLTYDNTASTPLVGVTVMLKLEGNEVASTVTDANGYYEFTVCQNGLYTFEFNCSIPWAGVGLDDVFAVYDHTVGYVYITDPLMLLAADVDISTGLGNIDIGDVFAIYDRITSINPEIIPSGWALPDWLFENVSVNITGSDVIQNIKGICSGDVNGSYPY
ncbi:MAG: hypothetical protein NTW49_06660 [Bacteroidia bacterium]|nr:hypothetical protein [Bacteroidia bacterium]